MGFLMKSLLLLVVFAVLDGMPSRREGPVLYCANCAEETPHWKEYRGSLTFAGFLAVVGVPLAFISSIFLLPILLYALVRCDPVFFVCKKCQRKIEIRYRHDDYAD